ncbi:transcription cofactor vestigial-like protein 2 isoform X1 [Aquila chrysaetos chrysaetos]|uniref:transcription cofactor vestigial-like protein 2 isoform X1 n=1 Tax=Aquila chrysaetos chrysaetos TaxID=223781 RepID=UPI001176E7E9|nr:transcription cofactor vestigial-like protein 2 isoform X1 [Aquila chrysaetos chrysaetos]
MSCLDVMYQVYGPPQPYFAAAYSPYHQKLAFYSKMQEAPESGSSASASSSFSSHPAASIKEEDCSPEKERPPEAEYINSRCVLFTYFQGDISAVVDEHFSRALSQPSSFSLGSAKAARNAGSWRDGSFPMSQRSFPPSFWNSTYQPSSVPATLSSPLAAAAHSELPFAAAAAADPYAPASLHSHLHQGGPEPWHHAHHHHHHHHHHPYIGTQSTAYPRPAAMHEVYGPHFDPRYGSLLVPTASVRPHRLTPASVPTPVSPPCELGKSEAGAAAAWTTPGPFPNAAGEMSLGLNVDTGLQPQDKSKDLYWF